MVEFVIVLPVLLLIFFVVVEIGNALLSYNTLTKAVQDGARHASHYGRLGTTTSVVIDADLDSEIRNLIVYGNTQGTGTPLLDGLAPGQIDISIPVQDQVLITATYPYSPVFGLTLPSFGFGNTHALNVDLTAAVRMRAL
jgi:Flp pilus assembly protein TadG